MIIDADAVTAAHRVTCACRYRTVEAEGLLDDGEKAVQCTRQATLRFEELDLNADGKPDVIVGNKKGSYVFLQQR